MISEVWQRLVNASFFARIQNFGFFVLLIFSINSSLSFAQEADPQKTFDSATFRVNLKHQNKVIKAGFGFYISRRGEVILPAAIVLPAVNDSANKLEVQIGNEISTPNFSIASCGPESKHRICLVKLDVQAPMHLFVQERNPTANENILYFESPGGGEPPLALPILVKGMETPKDGPTRLVLEPQLTQLTFGSPLISTRGDLLGISIGVLDGVLHIVTATEISRMRDRSKPFQSPRSYASGIRSKNKRHATQYLSQTLNPLNDLILKGSSPKSKSGFEYLNFEFGKESFRIAIPSEMAECVQEEDDAYICPTPDESWSLTVRRTEVRPSTPIKNLHGRNGLQCKSIKWPLSQSAFQASSFGCLFNIKNDQIGGSVKSGLIVDSYDSRYEISFWASDQAYEELVKLMPLSLARSAVYTNGLVVRRPPRIQRKPPVTPVVGNTQHRPRPQLTPRAPTAARVYQTPMQTYYIQLLPEMKFQSGTGSENQFNDSYTYTKKGAQWKTQVSKVNETTVGAAQRAKVLSMLKDQAKLLGILLVEDSIQVSPAGWSVDVPSWVANGFGQLSQGKDAMLMILISFGKSDTFSLSFTADFEDPAANFASFQVLAKSFRRK